MTQRESRVPSRMPFLVVLALSCWMAGPAEAQYTNYMRPGVNFTTIAGAQADITLSQMIRTSQAQAMMLAVKQEAERQQAGAKPRPAAPAAKGAPASQASAPAAPAAPLTATDFQPAGARQVPDQISAAVANAKDRAQMTKVCRQIQATIEATPGFRKNNMSSAMALLLGISLQVITGREFDDAQSDQLMASLNNEIVAAGGFAKLTNDQRTRAYDTMVITGGLIAGLAQNGAEGDATQAAVAKTMARDALLTFGLAM